MFRGLYRPLYLCILPYLSISPTLWINQILKVIWSSGLLQAWWYPSVRVVLTQWDIPRCDGRERPTRSFQDILCMSQSSQTENLPVKSTSPLIGPLDATAPVTKCGYRCLNQRAMFAAYDPPYSTTSLSAKRGTFFSSPMNWARSASAWSTFRKRRFSAVKLLGKLITL